MQIEHSRLFHDFGSFWFDTHVDAECCYETFVDFQRRAWTTRAAGRADAVLLSGSLDPALPDVAMIERLKAIVETAIRNALN